MHAQPKRAFFDSADWVLYKVHQFMLSNQLDL